MARLPTGNRELIKAINRNIVLNLVKNRGPISRTQLVLLSRLSPATISEISAALLSAGILKETGEGESSGGRRPILLTLDAHAGFVVGLKLTESAIILALTDLTAEVLDQSRSQVDTSQGVEAVLGAIAQAVEETILRSGVDRSKVLGVGIGMAGVIDGQAGVCRYSPILGWRDVLIAEPLEEKLGLLVYVDNDVNTLAMAEQWFGYGREVDHFLTVTVGRGVGLGIVVNGQFYRGAGGAGEFGHITLEVDGPTCDCGKRGCLEALASDSAVVREVEEALRTGHPSLLDAQAPLTVERIVEAAERGDAIARAALARSGRALGIGIANLINIFHPQLVIVGGEGVRAGPLRLESMQDAIRQHVFDGLGESVQIVVEPSGDETWARGAASIVLGELFRYPLFALRRVELSLVAS